MSTIKEVRDWIKKNEIIEIECLVPDITGNAKGKIIPANEFLEESIRMPEGILTQAVTGEFPDDYWELIETVDGDMYLKPDLSTVRVIPRAEQPTAQIIHD